MSKFGRNPETDASVLDKLFDRCSKNGSHCPCLAFRAMSTMMYLLEDRLNVFNVNGQYNVSCLVYNNWNSGTDEANGEMVSVNHDVGYHVDHMQAGCVPCVASWMLDADV